MFLSIFECRVEYYLHFLMLLKATALYRVVNHDNKSQSNENQIGFLLAHALALAVF